MKGERDGEARETIRGVKLQRGEREDGETQKSRWRRGRIEKGNKSAAQGVKSGKKGEGRKEQGGEGRAERREGRLQNEEVQEKRSGVWKWPRLEKEDVQRVCLSELPMVGFPLYRLAL